jgi:hypothetical protein
LKQPLVVILESGCIVVTPASYYVNGKEMANNQSQIYQFSSRFLGDTVGLIRKYFEANPCNALNFPCSDPADMPYWFPYLAFMTLVTNSYKHIELPPRPESVNVLRYVFKKAECVLFKNPEPLTQALIEKDKGQLDSGPAAH